MRHVIGTVTIVMALGWIATVGAQEKPALEAFSHYEQIRVALSNDTLAETAKHAKALAPLAGAVAGTAAKKAARGCADTFRGSLSGTRPEISGRRNPRGSRLHVPHEAEAVDAARRHDEQSVLR
jgi:hypothetical protein